MTIQFLPEPRRPFQNIGTALGQGISQGFERQRSGDILDSVINQALNQDGDILSNLLQGLQGSGATLPEALETVQRFAPIIETQRKSQENQQANALIENLVNQQSGLIPPSTEDRTPLTTSGQTLNNDQVDTIFNESSFAGSAPRQSKTKIESLPDSKLTALQGHPNQAIQKIADAEAERRKRDRKVFEVDREFASKRARPFLQKIDEERDAVRQKEFAIDAILTAIETGDNGFFTQDNLANITGIEALRTAKGVQLITGLKEFLLGNIQRAGARPNQWIEQQIAQMAPKIGRTKEANLTVAKMLKSETDLQRKKIEVTDQITSQMRNQLGFVPENIAQLVDENTKPFALEAQSNLAYDLRKIHEEERGVTIKDINKKVPKGTPLTQRAGDFLTEKFQGDVDKAIEQAKRLGYRIPTPEEFRRWES